ncbi:hypothetical protein F0562_027585 [Nyssa sinensis]|uniref:ACB domain-containing protein n=1 Tax=Nyssa sinensis TaxID=561372 RepID=A0A5J5B3E1_9ASTE|nr:hypothetical protein F0562_027585 [Nyssa sinensis]
MELFHDLLMTAFFALAFSFIVAKLVSMTVAGDDARDSSKNVDFETVAEEVKFERGLRGQSTKTKKKVRFVEEVKTVDEFKGEESVDKLESSRCKDEFEEKRCDSVEICDSAGRLKVEEGVVEVSEVVGLAEKSSEGGFNKEEVAAEIGGGLEFGIKEENRLTGFDGLVIEERNDSTKAADEFDGANVKAVVSIGMDVEEKIIENARDDDKTAVELARDDHGDRIEEVRGLESGENQGSGIEGALNKGDEEEELDDDEDDDWEGIERSELEKVFAAASNYVCCGGKDGWLANLGNDVQMQLYGLHKVAMEGSCHESQPMALKGRQLLCVSDGGHWFRCVRNAWQRLGNMSPEVAMEQYINLLSDTVPGWMENDPAGDGKQDFSQAGILGAPDSDINTYLHNQPNYNESQLKSSMDGGDLIRGSNSI